MRNINSYRVFKKNEAAENADGDYVLYWMQINRRFHYNYALEYAVGWANKLGKPLLVFEALSVDYPWRTARTHHFIIEGMAEHQHFADENKINYYSFLEENAGDYPLFLRSWLRKPVL